MLKIAGLKNNYRDLSHQFLGKSLSFEGNCFALVASSGVFTQGHALLDGLDEKRRQLEEAGLWRFIAASERYNSAPLEDTLISQVFVFQVL